MASEIKRVDDGSVAAVGGNAIRDGDRYLISILFPSAARLLTEEDLGDVFEVRDTALFFTQSTYLQLTGLPDPDNNNLAEFRPIVSTSPGPRSPTAA